MSPQLWRVQLSVPPCIDLSLWILFTWQPLRSSGSTLLASQHQEINTATVLGCSLLGPFKPSVQPVPDSP